MSSSGIGEVNTPFRTSYVQSVALGSPKACYANLKGYNSHVRGTINGPVSVQNQKTSRVQIIPVWGTQGYESLTHGGRNDVCGGYYTIEGAYPDYSSKCGRYLSRLCNGVIHQ